MNGASLQIYMAEATIIIRGIYVGICSFYPLLLIYTIDMSLDNVSTSALIYNRHDANHGHNKQYPEGQNTLFIS